MLVKRAFWLALAVVLLIAGGVTWKVMADRADRLEAGPGAGGLPPNVILPDNYQPTEEEQAWIDSHTGSAGTWMKEFGDYRFVLVTMGEKPTGGYAVVVDKVSSSDGAWLVDVKFVSPGPGDMVTQVITYPYGFVKIKNDGATIAVRDVTSGQPVNLPVAGE